AGGEARHGRHGAAPRPVSSGSAWGTTSAPWRGATTVPGAPGAPSGAADGAALPSGVADGAASPSGVEAAGTATALPSGVAGGTGPSGVEATGSGASASSGVSGSGEE